MLQVNTNPLCFKRDCYIPREKRPIPRRRLPIRGCRKRPPSLCLRANPFQGDCFNSTIFPSHCWIRQGQYHAWELNGGQNGIKVEARDPLEGHLKLMHEYTDADIHNLLTYLETLK